MALEIVSEVFSVLRRRASCHSECFSRDSGHGSLLWDRCETREEGISERMKCVFSASSALSKNQWRTAGQNSGRPRVNELVLQMGACLAEGYNRSGVHEVYGRAVGAFKGVYVIVWTVVLGGKNVCHPFEVTL